MDRIDTATRPLDALCDDIVVRYHAPLRRRLLRIRAMLVLLTAGGESPVDLMQCRLADLVERIESHLSKEEHLLFPAIAALAVAEREQHGRPRSPFATILHPIRMLEAEHATIESGLEQLRSLVAEVSGPRTLTSAWQVCMADLADLEAVLREDHRTENEVLFPGALDIERRLL